MSLTPDEAATLATVLKQMRFGVEDSTIAPIYQKLVEMTKVAQDAPVEGEPVPDGPI